MSISLFVRAGRGAWTYIMHRRHAFMMGRVIARFGIGWEKHYPFLAFHFKIMQFFIRNALVTNNFDPKISRILSMRTSIYKKAKTCILNVFVWACINEP